MESTKIRENFRQVKLKAEEIQLFKDSFVIVPYQVSGFIDYTNRGATSEVVKPEDFETFKRVWTGNDACSLVWKGSFRLYQNPDTKKMEQELKLGEVFLGVMETNSFDNELKKDESFVEYTSQQQVNTVTFRVDKYFKITDYYNFMFYKIPELSGSTLYRIDSIEKDFVGRNLIGYVITFKTINQELANTGRARQQNIMPCSPGQGYLECIVEDEKWPEKIGKEQFDKLVEGKDYYKIFDRYITANNTKIFNDPIKKVIVKALGNGIISSFSMTGRPASINSIEFGPTRKLFCINFTSPNTPTLFRTQSSVQNYYASKFNVTLQYYKEFFKYLKDTISNINKFEYQGWIEFPDTIQGTNKQEGLYSDWLFNLGEQETKDLYTPGVATTYKTKEIRNVDNFFFDNYWTSKNMKLCPLNNYATLDYGTTMFGGTLLALGSAFKGNLLGFAAGLTLSIVGLHGINRTLQQKSKFQGLNGITPKDIIDFNLQLYEGLKVPFNLYDNSTQSKDNGSDMFFKSNTINMCFEADITDTFISDRVLNKELSTLNIGQKQFEDGTNILPDGETFLLNGDAKLKNTKADGFIIDNFQFCGIFNGEISVEFLNSNGDIVWSGIYQSEAKWTENQREIWTEKNLSIYGRENIFIGEPVPYPKPIKMSWEDEIPEASELLQEIGGHYIQNNTSEDLYLEELSWIYYEQWTSGGIFEGITHHYFYGWKQLTSTPKSFIMNTNRTWNDIVKKFKRFKVSIVQNFKTKRYGIYYKSRDYGANIQEEVWSQTFNISSIKQNERISLNLNVGNFGNKLKSIRFADFMAFELWSTLPYNNLELTFNWVEDDEFVNILGNGVVTSWNEDAWKSPRLSCLYGTEKILGWSKSLIAPNGEMDTRMYLKVEFLE